MGLRHPAGRAGCPRPPTLKAMNCAAVTVGDVRVDRFAGVMADGRRRGQRLPALQAPPVLLTDAVERVQPASAAFCVVDTLALLERARELKDACVRDGVLLTGFADGDEQVRWTRAVGYVGGEPRL